MMKTPLRPKKEVCYHDFLIFLIFFLTCEGTARPHTYTNVEPWLCVHGRILISMRDRTAPPVYVEQKFAIVSLS